MRVVIDTNILVGAAKDLSTDHIAVLTLLYIFKQSLMLDYEEVLLGEYRDNVGRCVLFQKWYQAMQTGQLICWGNGHLPQRMAAELRRRHFHESEDQVVVALAVHGDKYIVTEDSDFGKGNIVRAIEHRDVLAYLTHDLRLIVHNAREACERLGGADRS